jgi:uncharacterized protein
MVGASTHGTPTWVDLSTPDVQAAADFYARMLGWTIDKHTSPVGDYYLGTVSGHEVGGMMAAPPEVSGLPAAWTVLFDVADVDATVAAVEEAGGSILEQPFDLPDARIAIVADCTGAMFGVVSHATPTGPWLSSAPGAVCWVELLTRDPEAAIGFYASVFGWHASTESYGDVSYTTFTLDGELVAGAMMMPGEVPVELSAVWSVYFAVEDCDAGERRAKELGGQVIKPTTQVGEGRFAVLEDPQGGTFQLMDQRR